MPRMQRINLKVIMAEAIIIKHSTVLRGFCKRVKNNKKKTNKQK